MISLKPAKKTPTNLELVIEAHLFDMYNITDKKSPEYAKMIDQLVKIQPLLPAPAERKKLDPNVLITLAANLVICGAVVEYEKVSLVTSKLFGFITAAKP